VGRGKLRVLVFLLACPAFAGCTSGTIHAPTKSSAHVEASPTGTQSSAPANDDVAPPTLSGSFVMDLTWVSHTTGWALAASPCSEGLCPQVARTRDGGATWERLPPPPASIQNGYVDCARQACVTNIRFASPSVGYLFGPALLLTRDGGRTWVREPGPPVEDLEPVSAKGKTDPIPVWRAVHARSRVGQPEAATRTPFVGREHERTIDFSDRIGSPSAGHVHGCEQYVQMGGLVLREADLQHALRVR